MTTTSQTAPGTRSAVRTLTLDPSDRPFIVIWEVTRACALACAHCRADAITRRNSLELSTDEGKALLDDLAGLGAPRPIVVLTGGDPFERDDLVELVRHGHDLGLPMALSPSVTPRLTSEALIELREAGASAVSLSLDGATPATHDAFRGFDGVHADTIEAAANVRAAGFRLQINTTVTRDNAQELPALLDTVMALGASLWSVFFLVPTGRGEQLVALDARGVEDVLMWLASVADRVPVKTTEAPHFRRVMLQRAEAGGDPPGYEPGPVGRALRAATVPPAAAASDGASTPRTGAGPRRPPLDVNAGRGFAFVDHLGVVYPSGFLPRAAGSARKAPFTEIYRRSEVLASPRAPPRLGGRCARRESREVCRGSRSHAYAVTGDPLAEDPTCFYEPVGRDG